MRTTESVTAIGTAQASPSLPLFFLLCKTDSGDHGREEEEDDGFEEVAKVEPWVPVIHGAFLCKLERGTEAGDKDGLLQGHGKREVSHARVWLKPLAC